MVPSSETKGQLVGAGKSLPVPTNCPWVSEDEHGSCLGEKSAKRYLWRVQTSPISSDA